MNKPLTMVLLVFALASAFGAAQTVEDQARIDYQAAKRALGQGKHGVALAKLEAVMKVLGEQPELLALAAECAVALKDTEKASEYVKKAFAAADAKFRTTPAFERLVNVAADLEIVKEDRGPRESPSPSATAQAQDIMGQARRLWEQRDYKSVSALLGERLKADPNDDGARGVQAIALLAQRNREEADQHIAFLERRAGSSPEARRVLDQVRAVVAKLEKRREFEAALLAAIAAGDAKRARELVDGYQAPPAAALRLRIQLAALAADFTTARQLVDSAQPDLWLDVGEPARIRKSIAETEKAVAKPIDDIDFALFSPWTLATWDGESYSDFPALDRFSVPGYLDAVAEILRLVPLSARAADLRFHALLLTAPAETLTAAGDRLLGERGQIAIPFLSKDRYYDLVIDKGRSRIWTREDTTHRALAIRVEKGCGGCWTGGRSCEEKLAPCYRIIDPKGNYPGMFSRQRHISMPLFKPFDVSFEEIVEISQDAKHPQWIYEADYALKITSSRGEAVAAQYALMGAIQNIYGREAQREVTKKLGEFLLHVIGRPAVKARLETPGQATTGEKVEAVMKGVQTVAGGLQAAGGSVTTPMLVQALGDVVMQSSQNIDLLSRTANDQLSTWQQQTLDLTAQLPDVTVEDLAPLLGR